MAHFAKINDDGIVENIIFVDNAHAPDPAPENSENLGRKYLSNCGISGHFVQTSISNSFRKQYASIGGRYDKNNDIFIDAQPWPSWTLDKNFDWKPPLPSPKQGNWMWNEKLNKWIEVK
jgi:hypothetical protein